MKTKKKTKTIYFLKILTVKDKGKENKLNEKLVVSQNARAKNIFTALCS